MRTCSGGRSAAHVAAGRTEGGWPMAGDALDGDVRRLRYSGRGGGNGDPLGYRPVRSEGDGGGGGGGGASGRGSGGVGAREDGRGDGTDPGFRPAPLEGRRQGCGKSRRV